LFYNDYDQESSVAKTEAILNMVRDFARRRVPIDGLGLQMHLRVGTPVEGIARAIRDLAATGLLIHVSELDISVNPGRNPGLTYGSELQERQAQLYYEVVHLYRTLVPRSQQWGITTWNVGDADSWLRFRNGKDWPLLFDSSYRKKITYAAFVRGLTQ
jgi:endo-1,4-beta-xylanase